MANGGSSKLSRFWCSALACTLLAFLEVDDLLVNITYLDSAVAPGAVCLDGSPPAYHLARGFGSGVDSWLVFFEVGWKVCLDGSPPAYHLAPGFGSGVDSWLVFFKGGAWCNNVTTCLQRKLTDLGSSKEMEQQVNFTAILSNVPEHNPDFYNWNKVKVRYCDGSSYTGDKEEVDPTTKLYYRGARVWKAVMEDLVAKGMDKAENALISGCSAGGLTVILHCDKFRNLLPGKANVKCLSDGGFFMNVKDIAGEDYAAAYFNEVATTHGSAKNLPSSCTSKLPPGMYLFPQKVVKQIQTPLFILNAAYDNWQISHILVPEGSDPSWSSCRGDISQCSTKQLKTLRGFRDDFLRAVEQGSSNSTTRGLFINSCFLHCQSQDDVTWFAPGSPVLGGKKIANAVGDWFYECSPFQKIDCPYPCDSSSCLT